MTSEFFLLKCKRMYDLESLDSYGTNMQQVGRQRLWPSKISSQNAIIRANYALKFGNWYFEQYVPKPILDNANLLPKDMTRKWCKNSRICRLGLKSKLLETHPVKSTPEITRPVRAPPTMYTNYKEKYSYLRKWYAEKPRARGHLQSEQRERNN